MFDLRPKFPGFAKIALERVAPGKPPVGQRELGIQPDGFLHLMNRSRHKEASRQINPKLIVPVGFKVGCCRLFDAGSIGGYIGRRHKALGDAARHRIHHAEDALDVRGLHLVGKKNLTGFGVLNLHVEPKLLGADAQERAGDRMRRRPCCAPLSRPRPGRVHSLPSSPVLNLGENALGREHVQTLDLGQIRREHFGQAAVQPVERGILRKIGKVKDRQSLMAFRCCRSR